MSKDLKSPANTEAREKGIEERSYDLSVLTKEERINLLSLLYDDVRDVQDYLFLRVMDSPFDSCFTFDEFVYFTRLLKDHIDYCEHRLAENPFFPSYFVQYSSLSTSALDKLLSLLSQSDVTGTEPQEQEREEPQEENSAVFTVTLHFEDGNTFCRSFKYRAFDDIQYLFNLCEDFCELSDFRGCVFNLFNFADCRGRIMSIELSCDTCGLIVVM